MCLHVCVCVTEWVRDDPSGSNLWCSVLKRQCSTLELVFQPNPRHRHKQKYFPDTPETQEGTIEGQNTKSCQCWMAEGSPGWMDGGKGGRGREEQKERQIYDPVRKARFVRTLWAFRAFYRRFRRRRRRKDAEVGSDREKRSWAGTGGPLSREWTGYKQGEIRISGRSNSRKDKNRRWMRRREKAGKSERKRRQWKCEAGDVTALGRSETEVERIERALRAKVFQRTVNVLHSCLQYENRSAAP